LSKYLVTGGAGFIGSHIVDRLVQDGQEVRVLDNLSTGKLSNIQHNLGEIEFMQESLADLDAVKRAVEGVDYVLHQGAIPSVPRSVADPLASNEAGVNGTLNLLVAARDAGVKRVVYASSSSVYGDSPTLPKHEKMETKPLSPYAITKLAGEHYLRVFCEIYGLETVSLRYFNVFGPRQDPTNQYAAVIPKFITIMIRGDRPPIYGDGLQSRDFTYVSNNVNANLLACEAPGVGGEVFNIACGARYTLLDLVAAVNGILGTKIEPILEAERPGEVKHSQAEISKARERMGFEPGTTFQEGLEILVKWIKDHPY
jgi:UDP-glucose 4-epimerase